MAACDAQSLLAASCKFNCLSGKELEVVKAELLCQILQASNPMASCDAQTLLNAGKAFNGLPAQQLNVIQTQLLCEILSGGGTGGATCVLCGVVDPTTAPTSCNCAFYYRTDNAAVWFWNNGSSSWTPLIAA